MSSEQRSDVASRAGMARVVDRNIEALLARRRAEERALGWQERIAAGIRRFAGNMAFAYVHPVVYGLWVAINLPWSPDVLRFDPTSVVLAMEASVEAIVLSTFIADRAEPDDGPIPTRAPI